jgi:hypothetical protein
MWTINWRDTIMFRAFRFLRVLRLDKLLLFRSLSYPFSDFFRGLENIEAIKRIFGEKTNEVLNGLRVDFTMFGGYMGVNPFNGHLMVNPRYLNSGDRLDIYLDLIHELVHIRQRMEGAELFDANYGYVDRPTEIEAYRYAVEEARRLEKSEERICDYLKTKWMSDDDFRQLAKALNVKC